MMEKSFFDTSVLQYKIKKNIRLRSDCSADCVHVQKMDALLEYAGEYFPFGDKSKKNLRESIALFFIHVIIKLINGLYLCRRVGNSTKPAFGYSCFLYKNKEMNHFYETFPYKIVIFNQKSRHWRLFCILGRPKWRIFSLLFLPIC